MMLAEREVRGLFVAAPWWEAFRSQVTGFGVGWLLVRVVAGWLVSS